MRRSLPAAALAFALLLSAATGSGEPRPGTRAPSPAPPARRGAPAPVAPRPNAPVPAPAAQPPPQEHRLGPQGPDTVPVVRAGTGASRTVPLLPLFAAEAAARRGETDDALARFRALAAGSPNDERKGYVYLRIGEILLSRSELEEALSAADNAVLLSKARFLLLSAMDLKMRVAQRLPGRSTEVRDLAGYLLAQEFAGAAPVDLLSAMARSEAAGGRLPGAMNLFRRAIQAAGSPEEAARLREERDAVVDQAANVQALYLAAEAEEDPELKGRLFLAIGRIAVRRGFTGMGAWAFDRAAKLGAGPEGVEQHARLDMILAARPRIVGLVPLSGPLGSYGFSVLAGAEAALAGQRQPDDAAGGAPVLTWVDTGGSPDRARREYAAFAADRGVIGFIGPLTGEEGRAVGATFAPKSPPLLYLGQKAVPERPFLYAFGLSPLQEARAVLSWLERKGIDDLLFLYPDNGYGKGYAEAVSAASKDTGVRVAKAIAYPPGQKDFTAVIKSAVGKGNFSRQAHSSARGKGMKLPLGAVLIADHWDRVFLIASQLRYYNVYLPLAGFSGWNDESLIRKAGDAVSGAVFSVDYASAVPDSRAERFRREFQEAMRFTPSRFEAMGYDGARLLASAFELAPLREARTLPEAMRDRITRLKAFDGATGGFQFGLAGDMRRRVPLLRVELGNFVPAEP